MILLFTVLGCADSNRDSVDTQGYNRVFRWNSQTAAEHENIRGSKLPQLLIEDTSSAFAMFWTHSQLHYMEEDLSWDR